MPTTVTGTLRDSLGQLWTNAPVQFVFQPTASTPGPFSWSGGVFNPMPPRINTDANGFFTIVLPANNEIAPAGSYWQWIVGPSASYPAFVFNLTLATGALDVSPLFAAQAQISLVQSFAVPRAYSDAEVIIPPNMGQLYYDTSLKCLKYYENGQWNIITASSSQIAHPTSPTGVLTGVTGNPANPVPVVYFINANGLPDEKVTTITEGTKTFEMQFVNDTYTAANTLLQWHRTGYTADSCVLTVGNLLTIRGASSATVATIDGTGAASFNGAITSTGGINLSGASQVSPFIFVQTDAPVDQKVWYLETFAGSQMRWRTVSDTGANDHVFFMFDRSGLNVNTNIYGNLVVNGQITANVTIMSGVEGTTRFLATPSSGAIYLDAYGPDNATSGSFNIRTQHADGSGNLLALRIDGAGNGYFAGAVNGTAKNFVIPHPLDETKDLWHSCLEGPEYGVFYRGEAVTENGVVEVTLPPYFEALTYTEDRSVLLTVIVDDAAPVFGGQIAAGRIVAGKFKIYSEAPAVTIAWEVKAIRKFGDSKLVVEPQKAEVIK